MRILLLALAVAVSARAQSLTKEKLSEYSNPLQKPAQPTVPIKTSEDKRKQWKPGEVAHIQGKVIQNTGDGLLISGAVKGVKRTAGLFFLKGSFKTNQGAAISAQATYDGEKTYTSVSESQQTVPAFVPR